LPNTIFIHRLKFIHFTGLKSEKKKPGGSLRSRPAWGVCRGSGDRHGVAGRGPDELSGSNKLFSSSFISLLAVWHVKKRMEI